MAKKITWHPNPAERTFIEKVARRFVFPRYDRTWYYRLDNERWEREDARRKRRFPVQWFFSHALPDFNRGISRKVNDARDWVRWRTYDRYHVIKTDLTPNYYDKDEILLYANFKILKDYVEIELANMESYCSSDANEIAQKWREFKTKVRGVIRVHSHERNPEMGVRYLQSELREFSPSIQATAAKEKLDLYLWWTVIRPAREDLYKTPLIWANEEDAMSLTRGNNDEYKQMHKLEDFYNDEDEEMLIRLMKVRKHLWS